MAVNLFMFSIVSPFFGLFIIFLIIRFCVRRTTSCPSDEMMDGKTVIITGANSGLGKTLAIELATRGAKVYLACRNKLKGEAAAIIVRRKAGSSNVFFQQLDLANMASIQDFVKAFCKDEPKLDVLINNAGVMTTKDWTDDGFDLIMGVNFFGPFLLTNLLLDKLKQASSSRIINVISNFGKDTNLDLDNLNFRKNPHGYNIINTYNCSKKALFLFTQELADDLQTHGVIAIAAIPGVTKTALLRNFPGIKGNILRLASQCFFREPEEGIQTLLYCATAKNIDNESGKKIYDCKAIDVKFKDGDNGKKLVDKTKLLWESKGAEFEI